MADTQTPVNWGFLTTAELAAVEEMFALFTNVNAAGIPDTRVDVDTRVNAVWGRFMYDFMIAVNCIFKGECPLPPGLTGVGGTASLWRLHDDFSQHLALSDYSLLSGEPPFLAYACAGSRAELTAGGRELWNDDTPSEQRGTYHLVNVRGGVADNHFAVVTRALRTHRDCRYHSSTNDLLGNVDMAVSFRLHMTEFPQHNDKVVLISHRRYDIAAETGNSNRLDFEISLAPGPTGDSKDRVLQYRDMTSADVERKVIVGSSGTEKSTLPLSGDTYITVTRTPGGGGNQGITIYVNGINVHFEVITGVVLPGTDPNMRLVVGGNWDGSGNSNAGFRDIAVWQAVNDLPLPANILNLARLTAGFNDIGAVPP